MEQLLQHLERFSEVLAVSRSTYVGTWDPATVRRALRWAHYLRHVYRRFRRHGRIRAALERWLHSQWDQKRGLGLGLTNFRALESCDVLLSVCLLRNRALGDAARHYLLQQLGPGPGGPDADRDSLRDGLCLLARRRAAVHLLRLGRYREGPKLQEDLVMKTQAQLLRRRLREVGEAEAEGPGRLLSRLWERLPHDHLLKVIAAALVETPASPRPQEEERELGGPETSGSQELVQWLLGKSEIVAVFCRQVPASLLTSVASRHPELWRVYLRLLTDWSRRLRYDLQKGIWIGDESQDVPWEELSQRFQSLLQAPSPLSDEVLTTLRTYKAQDGDFDVPGLSIWTDLLLGHESAT